jgi:hypothetical protein
VFELRLDTLDAGIPALTPKRAGVHMEACVWCLKECGHENGTELKVIDDQNEPCFYKVTWPKSQIDMEAIIRAYNKDDGPEYGAVAIALLLIREKTDFTAIHRAVSRTGIDYWLGYKKSSKNQIFKWENARLEVSGILKQSSTNKVKYRISKKIKQTKQSDHISFPAYVIVVEFSQPIAEMVKRDA